MTLKNHGRSCLVMNKKEKERIRLYAQWLASRPRWSQGDNYAVCRSQFFDKDGNPMPDKVDPDTSLPEVDAYSWIPAKWHDQMPNHRLSLRYRYSTKEFEVYRRLWTYPNSKLKKYQIAFKSNSLQDACEFINTEYKKWFDDGTESTFIECNHEDVKRSDCWKGNVMGGDPRMKLGRVTPR